MGRDHPSGPRGIGNAMKPDPTEPFPPVPERFQDRPQPNDGGPSSMLALIDSYARDQSIDVEKFARLLQLRERSEAREAELAFNDAKARIKRNLQGVRFHKTRAGPDNAYRYLPLDEIDKHLGPLLAAESMDLWFTDELMPNGWILTRGRLKHLPGGHYEDSTMPLPPDTVNKMKSAIQSIGSTNSYARRYITANIFKIVVIGDDDDGTGGTIDDAQVAYLREMIIQIEKIDPRKDEAAFCKFMRVPKLEDIAYRDYRRATGELEKRIQDANPA
jgi:hypothetical protein